MKTVNCVLGAFAAVTVMVGCGGAGGDDDDYDVVIEEQRSWPASGVGALTIVTETGDVTMWGGDLAMITADITRSCDGTNRADAEAHIGNVAVTDAMNGDTLTLEAAMPNGPGHNYRADFDATGPASLPVNILTISGEIIASNMTGGAVLTATNGVVRTENHEGLLDANAINGSIYADVAYLQSPDSAILGVANGEALLQVPDTAGLTFDVSSAAGDARVLGFRYVAYTLNTTHHKKGTINGGGAVVQITSATGDVTLRAR